MVLGKLLHKIKNRLSINNLFRKFYLSKLYESKVGVKSLNQIISSDIFDAYIKYNPTNNINKYLLHPKELKLSFDGLFDNYTHLNKNIFESPHFELVSTIFKKLNENGGGVNIRQNIRESKYIELYRKGKLDFRNPASINGNLLKFIEKQFFNKLELIKANRILEIKIFLINNEYYIADGKHSAAMSALFDKKCLCYDITPLIFDSWFYWIYLKMKNSHKRRLYSKHINFFKKIYNEE